MKHLSFSSKVAFLLKNDRPHINSCALIYLYINSNTIYIKLPCKGNNNTNILKNNKKPISIFIKNCK